jgi:hypothetical protein
LTAEETKEIFPPLKQNENKKKQAQISSKNIKLAMSLIESHLSKKGLVLDEPITLSPE